MSKDSVSVGALWITAAALTLTACGGARSGPPGGGAEPLPLGFSAATTDGLAATTTLLGQIEAGEEALERRPDLLAFRQELVGNRLAAVRFLGTYSALPRLDALTAEGLATAPSTPEAHVDRARYLAAVHEFASAASALAAAEGLGLRRAREEGTSYEIATGGDLEGALHLRTKAAAEHPSFSTLADLAVAHAAVGEFDRADELYREALDLYRDVSPFPVAWVFFQRGFLWSEMADQPERGRPLYEEAVRRLPSYVAANVHLAELELAEGAPAVAIARLRPIAATTDDPEPSARLAQWLAGRDADEAARFTDRARAGYEALLARYPKGFADHAIEFFLGAGADPQRALALAQENLRHRKNDRAFLLGIKAAADANRPDALCEVVAQVPARASRSNRALATLVERHASDCPRARDQKPR